MKLVRIENYTLAFDDELLLLKPFRVLYDADDSDDKHKFVDFLTLIYFAYDPRSDYSYIADEEERLEEICKTNDIRRRSFTKRERACIELYKSLTQSTASKLLEDTRITIEGLRAALRNVDFDDIVNGKDKATAIKSVAATVSMIPKIIKDLSDAERAVARETAEQGRARGSQSKTIMDDGILV